MPRGFRQMKTCLIVDDSRVVKKVASRIIRDLGFTVTEAGHGAEALQMCRESMPDAILLDWNMPVMNGLDFVKALRREDGGKAPRVVFCSIENDAEHIQEALRSGADEFVMKPFDADILESKFAEVGLI
jgi:two-component system, chemotaxis family, chemotaxis protein CheY